MADQIDDPMSERDFRPAALAVVRILLRVCGWESIYQTGTDAWTIGKALAGPVKDKPSSKEIERIVKWAQGNMSAIFRTERDYIADFDINAAVLATADLLNRQSFNDLLLEAVTDSSALEGYLLANGGARIRNDLLSENAIWAFDILLRSSCRHLAEVTLSAPEFGPLALQRLLRGQGQLERIAQDIFQSLTSLAQPGPAEEDIQEFTSRYLTKISEQLDFLDIPGIDLERYRQRYSLTAAYIPITTRHHETHESEFSSLESMLDISKVLLIAGEPGSGKTTLLKWAAVQAARSHAKNSHRKPLVPFLIKLRSLPESLPELNNIGAPFADGLVIPRPENWSLDLIKDGRSLLLFDGLDEVPEHRRETVVKWIEQISEDCGYRGTNIIVTSRIAAIREKRFKPWNATLATLQPMPQGKVERYIRVWHRAVYQNADVSDLADWLAASDQLLARLEDDIHLSRLASNPLLCAVICALYHARSHHLPSERSELYEALLAMLLARRDSERKGIESFLSLTDAQRLSEQVALSFLKVQQEEMSRNQVIGILRSSLRTFRSPAVRDMRPTIVFDYFINRTGVLRELPGDVVDFWHKSFQEFLAAKILLARGRDRELLAHCPEAAWREVIIWACSLMEVARASKLIIGILDIANRLPGRSDRQYLFGLALSCSHYASQLSKRAQDRLSGCIGELTSPITSFDPSVILELGPAAVPLLETILTDLAAVEHEDGTIAKLIDALARIGGETANTALSQTSSKFKCRWASELGKGWSYTGSADYARRVLGEVPRESDGRVVPVLVESFRQLRGINYISSVFLIEVKISLADLDPETLGDGSVRPISRAQLLDVDWKDVPEFLNRYPAVEELDLILTSDCVDLGDKTPAIHAVRRLHIDSSSGILLDLNTLRIFPRLESLDITGNIRIMGKNGFSSNEKLSEVLIDLRHRWRYDDDFTEGLDEDFAWIGALQRLTYRDWDKPDLAKLHRLEQLQGLDVSGSTALETLTGIGDLSALASLNVAYCNSLRNIDEAFSHPSLSKSNMEGCEELSEQELLSFFVELASKGTDIREFGPDADGFSLTSDRSHAVLDTLPEQQISMRRWDDWWMWDEIHGNADEWHTPDPERADEFSAVEKGLTIYTSLDHANEFWNSRDANEQGRRGTYPCS